MWILLNEIGSSELLPLLNECYYHSNNKNTYYICPFRYVIQVNNMNPTMRSVMGYHCSNRLMSRFFSEIVGDPFSSETIQSRYTDGSQCPGHLLANCQLTIDCDKETNGIFEVTSVREEGACSVAIQARSPLVCTIRRNQKLTPSERDQLIDQAYATLVRIQNGLENIQMLLENL